MKKLLLFITVLTFTISSINAQDSKFYLGIGAGYASAGGDWVDGFELKKGGLNLNFINMGYRFNESWGATANLSSSGHEAEGWDGAGGIGVFSVGPMYSVPVGNMSWDIKPQYAFRIAYAESGDDAYDDYLATGSGFVLGNSLVMGSGKGFTWSIDIDYVSGKFTKEEDEGESYDIDEDNSFTNIKIGVGVRYNF